MSGTGSLVTAFLGSLQASVAVLLTVGYGVIASQYEILQESSGKDISQLCVQLFLPALLVSNIGEELKLETVARYVPVLIWSILYTLLSLGMGIATTKFFKLPTWAVPAFAFNNTTSLPLLLVQSLSATGILSGLLIDESDTTEDAVKRAKSYFLITAMVSNSLTFALGPRLLRGDEAPDVKKEEEEDYEGNGDTEDVEGNEGGEDGDVETGQSESNGGQDGVTERTSLLPEGVIRRGNKVGKHTYKYAYTHWQKLPPQAQSALDFLYSFVNAPLIGAVVGAIIGLTPPLQRAFFNGTQEGGIFRAWLTSSIQNIGDLFAALQLVVVGSKLGSSLRKMKRGEDSGHVPWPSMVFVFLVRFVLWPLVSIPLIWLFATKTTVLGNDPMLWFCMMLMPAGPPAMIIMALAEVNGCTEQEKMSISKFLTIAYFISPLICFSVTGSYNASISAISQ
ncbi:MAG: hypothetical protein M1833_005407 [Piccolia ochrophora]|nr:MAG: hypothetical protein M1833_005407 [Piccolia ochrophora]